jgi:uncharacterized protein (DUF2235 family)
VAQDATGVVQVISYHEGVGNSWHGHLVGGAFGYGLAEIIREAYSWLAQNFVAGDELYVFGFSRGAYSARSFVGLIRKCGNLKTPTENLVAAAYDLHRKKDADADSAAAIDFRASNSFETRVKLVGVWDTVGSLGVPLTGLKLPLFRDYYQFHDTELSKSVAYAYHSLALDEFRKDFAPALWAKTKPQNIEVEQLWFSGAHSDVGGGSDGGHLYEVALNWLQAKAERVGLSMQSLYEVEQADISAPIYDSFASFMFGLYRVLKFNRRFVRTFGGTVGEDIDESAKLRSRLALEPPYRPPVLAGVPN